MPAMEQRVRRAASYGPETIAAAIFDRSAGSGISSLTKTSHIDELLPWNVINQPEETLPAAA